MALTPVLAATSGYDIEIEFSLCDEHRRQRYLRSALAVGGVFVALAAAVFFATPVAVIACLALVVALAVFAFVQFRTVRLLELDAVQARIRVGPAFAGSFAEDLG